MGAKTWMLVYANGSARDALRRGPSLDRDASLALARELFPSDKLVPLHDTDLSTTSPPGREIAIGCFTDVSIIAAEEFGADHPSRLPARFLKAAGSRTVTLHAMHSVVDWFAYARWVNGTLVRSLSLSPDSGILEDIGARAPFEQPYWGGHHPAVEGDEEYPFPFHPLELGEAALAEFFGYQLEGVPGTDLLDPESVPLLSFARPPWWKFWRSTSPSA